MFDKSIKRERRLFKELIASNPNYFATGPADSPFEPVVELQGSTEYESICSVGYDPGRDRLDAVVHITEPTGYGGGLCSAGTPEYVRFYLSFDKGTTWDDKGVVSFRAYNIPEGTKGRARLEYAASLKIDELRRYCRRAETVRCRAILSWNVEPPPNQPAFQPVWGEVHNTILSTEPYRLLIPFEDFLEIGKPTLPDGLLDLAEAPMIPLAPPKTPPLKALIDDYRKEDVEPMRFGYPAIAQAKTAGVSVAEVGSPLAELAELDVDLQDLIGQIEEVQLGEGDGNTSYEELDCVGLFPNEDLLVGSVRIKRSTGFNGGPCTNGSREYVAFWADFDGDGSFSDYLGTRDFPAYDVEKVPRKGLEYSVSLPVDFSEHRQPCEEGPVLVPIRAVLSWASPPDPADPHQTPVWGNRVETVVALRAGPSADVPGAYLSILGGVAVSEIDDVTGLTTPAADFALTGITIDALGRSCPFGGLVTVQGYSFPGLSYRIRVREVGTAAWSPVLTPFDVTDLDGVQATHAPDATGAFAFLPFHQNIGGLLGRWHTAGDALWEVELQVLTAGGVVIDTDAHRIQLDNTWPVADIEITSGGGNCGKFGSGDPISGHFVARDDYFGSFSVSVTPNQGGIQLSSGGVPSPGAPSLSGTAQTPLAGSPWELDASTMPACGYNVRVWVTDRAVVNSGSVGHKASSLEGFCLE